MASALWMEYGERRAFAFGPSPLRKRSIPSALMALAAVGVGSVARIGVARSKVANNGTLTAKSKQQGKAEPAREDERLINLEFHPSWRSLSRASLHSHSGGFNSMTNLPGFGTATGISTLSHAG